jgi:hypothetical protein
MRSYEQELQKALLKVIEEHHPITKFEFGVQISYLHAIGRATISGRCDELEDKLFVKTQEYRSVVRSESENGG